MDKKLYMNKLNYSQTVPNSHYWTNLDSLIIAIEFDIKWHATKKEREEKIKKSDNLIIDAYEPLTMEHILTGLKNAQKNGYRLKKKIF